MSIAEGFRRFKSSVDRKLWLEYLLAIKEHFWETLWGATIVGIPFAIYTLYRAPSLPFLGWVVAWCVFVAGFFAWPDYHFRMQRNIDVTKVVPQKWTDTGTGRPAIAYYFELLNKSAAVTIRNVCVELAAIRPEVDVLNWLPVILRQKHDNVPLPHAAKTFDLRPGGVKHIDFVSAFLGSGYFDIEHIVAGVNRKVDAGASHELKVMITAQDMPAQYVWFFVHRDKGGVLRCGIMSPPEGQHVSQ